MYGPFYRVGDSPDVVRKILRTGELWGSFPRNIFQSDIPKVKAFRGKLPDGIKGIEFETETPPDPGSVPDKPTWSADPNRPGIVVEGEFAKIKSASYQRIGIIGARTMRTPSTAFEQLPLGEMEFGLAQPIAMTRAEPAELALKLSIRFEPANDDLDQLVTALIRGASGRQFALVRHLHQPNPGTTILTNERSRDFAKDLRDSLAALQMSLEDLVWVHPDAVAEACVSSTK